MFCQFEQVQHLVGRLTDMGVTEILPRKTYNIKDFFSRQQSLVEDFGKNFADFRNLVCQVKSTWQPLYWNYLELFNSSCSHKFLQ